jgi:hypothetical protein
LLQTQLRAQSTDALKKLTQARDPDVAVQAQKLLSTVETTQPRPLAETAPYATPTSVKPSMRVPTGGSVPYGIIADLLKKGEVIPFLGMGASLSGRTGGTTWDGANSDFLPTGSELARYLADVSDFPSEDENDRYDLSKVCSYYTAVASRRRLRERLHEVYAQDYSLGDIHRFLAELPVPLLIMTVNFDDLIERAFHARARPFHLVAYPTDRKDMEAAVLWWRPGATEPEAYRPKSLPLTLTDTTIIYKMHGTVDRRTGKWDSFVITEEDQVDFLSRMTNQTAVPARFMLEFRRRRFLFIGYSLRDWDLRIMLQNLRTTTSGGDEDSRSWAIQFRPSVLEQFLWQQRGVNVYGVEIEQFVSSLRERLHRTMG